jgi:cysteinyl-tRNA synthetase
VGEAGVRDPREVVGPFVEAMLELRARARAERRFEEADWIRERLEEFGIEVRDSPQGSEWLLA